MGNDPPTATSQEALAASNDVLAAALDRHSAALANLATALTGQPGTPKTPIHIIMDSVIRTQQS